mmetsp:Transcript_28074/g.37466  ORF Transcript_28074/g.37466 Transcript_28074/m.37466 type:complete len:111 (+) Transcript_28074:103-435(+)
MRTNSCLSSPPFHNLKYIPVDESPPPTSFPNVIISDNLPPSFTLCYFFNFNSNLFELKCFNVLHLMLDGRVDHRLCNKAVYVERYQQVISMNIHLPKSDKLHEVKSLYSR